MTKLFRPCLRRVCDPTLESCPRCDAYETALQAATRSGRGCFYHGLQDTPGTARCKELLKVAEECWPKASYASAHAGTRNNFTNTCKCSTEELRDRLSRVSLADTSPAWKVARIEPKQDCSTTGEDDFRFGTCMLRDGSRIDSLLLQAACYAGPGTSFEMVCGDEDDVGPQAVRGLLVRGANPLLKGYVRGSRMDYRAQYSHKGPKLIVTAGEAAAEAKATLRRYIDGVFVGTSTNSLWEYTKSKEEMKDKANALLSDEASLGESVALLEAAARVWASQGPIGSCTISTVHRIAAPGCLCPRLPGAESHCRFGPEVMAALRAAVASVPGASPEDPASVEALASAMWDAAEKSRAETATQKQREQEARAAEEQMRVQACAETLRQAQSPEFHTWLTQYLARELAFLGYRGVEIRTSKSSSRVLIDIKHCRRMKGHGNFINQQFTPQLKAEIAQRFVSSLAPGSFGIVFSQSF